MPPTLKTLEARARALQEQIEAKFAERREKLGYRVERGRIRFGAELRRRHRTSKVSLHTFLAATRPMVFLTAPLIYSVIIPFVLLDIMVTLYQWICFPIYGITRVRRREYIFIDRHQLGYLNTLQKINCMYCGYGNGIIAYAREVSGLTEAYWCPIKHASRVQGTHEHYSGFLDFGDEEDFIARWAEQRAKLKNSD